MDYIKNNETPKQTKFSFGLIEDLSAKAVEICREPISHGRDYVYWGKNNKYPEYLYDRYMQCSTLQSIINGTADYVAGNGANTSLPFTHNSNGDSLYDITQKAIMDILIFGGCALQIIRSKDNSSIADIIYVDVRRCRVSKESEAVSPSVFVSERNESGRLDWNKFPAFNPKSSVQPPISIYFYPGKATRSYYPVPIYAAAMLAIETQIEIQHFHYNCITNCFATNVVININSGIPSEDEKKEIENKFQDKYTGTRNSGKALIMFNDDKEHAATVEKMQDDNFDKKYEALAKSTRENIFAAFRATPALFGIMTETTGFSEQEFNEAFKLYSRTVVMPMQNEITGIFDYIFSVKDSITFIPFTIE